MAIEIEKKGKFNLIHCDKSRECGVCLWEGWTEGMKRLRELGFTVYSKDRIAFLGMFFHNMLQHMSIEVKHNKETKQWDYEFEMSFGKGNFEVRKTFKYSKCTTRWIFDDFENFSKAFALEFFPQIRIIRNIYCNIDD